MRSWNFLQKKMDVFSQSIVWISLCNYRNYYVIQNKKSDFVLNYIVITKGNPYNGLKKKHPSSFEEISNFSWIFW